MRRIALIIVVMSLSTALSAQIFISRSALDSLTSPTLSTTAQGVLSVKERVRDVGKIEDSSPLRVSFTLHNDHSAAVTIMAMKTSCSCLRITSPRATLEPEESYTLTAELNTAGRNGEFSYDILIYTSLDEARPTERLSLKGEITSTTPFAHLPEAMGCLRLSRRSVTVEGINTTTTRREHIAVANGGNQPLCIEAQTTVEGLQLRCEPRVLESGAEGDIIVEYRPRVMPTHDIETISIIEGVDAPAPQRMIRITIKR